MGAYVLFANSARQMVAAEHRTASFVEVTRILAAQWRHMTAADKAPFYEHARLHAARYFADKERHDSELRLRLLHEGQLDHHGEHTHPQQLHQEHQEQGDEPPQPYDEDLMAMGEEAESEGEA